MRFGCSTGLLASTRLTRNGRAEFASGPGLQWSDWRRSFPATRKRACWEYSKGRKAEKRFAEFANDEPCPVLDPETGLCDLYDARPMACRTFGPPVRAEGGLGVCELCFHGATDAQIAACEMVADPDDLESKLLRKLERREVRADGRWLRFACCKGLGERTGLGSPQSADPSLRSG